MAHPANSVAIGTEPITAMAALRAATAASHQRLEKRIDVKSRFSDLPAYRSHLQRMWGFCAPLEQCLRPESFAGALPDYDLRRKLPLLSRDLASMGADCAGLPRCADLPTELDAAAAFGCTYVMEGATLGGRVLLPAVHKWLGFTPDHGAAYLASYEDQVTPMWQSFGAALNDWCAPSGRRAAATRAAVMTFEMLTEWLCRKI